MPSLNDPRLDVLVSLGNWLRGQDYRFVTVTPATHERVNARPENRMARDLAGIFGWSRAFAGESLPADWLTLLAGADLIRREADGWRSQVRVSSLGEQLFVHSAFPTLAADAVFFGPDTYRFDRLIRSHLASSDPARIRRAADIGCGAGPGAIRIAMACPDAEVHGLDINPAALDLARVNAALAGVGNLTLARSDLLSQAPGRFDLIVANPPYLLDASERAYRHGGGMLGAGLSLAIVDAALERLEAGGSLLLYTGVAMVEGGDPFLARIRERLASREWDWDYQELDRTCSPKSWTAPPTAKPSGSPWSACGSLVPPEALQAFQAPHQILVQALPALGHLGLGRNHREDLVIHPLPGQAQAFRLGPAGGAHGAGETPPAAHVLDFVGGHGSSGRQGRLSFGAPRVFRFKALDGRSRTARHAT